MVVQQPFSSMVSEWNVFLKQRGIPVVSIVGLRDNIAPYDAGRHWDAHNVIVADQDHIGLADATDIVATVLYNRLRGPLELAGS